MTRARIVIAALLVSMLGLTLFMPTAQAHVDFIGSSPSFNEIVAEPIDEIIILFSGQTAATGDGFVVITPQGDEVRPDVSVNDEGTRHTMRFDPPLVDGEVAVSWSVLAGDSHLIEGRITFTTTAPAVVPTVAPTTAPAPEAATSEAVEPPEGTTPAAAESLSPTVVATQVPTATPVPVPSASPVPDIAGSELDDGVAIAAVDEDIVDQVTVSRSNGSADQVVGFLGRFASISGALLLVGATSFAYLVASALERRDLAQPWLIRIASIALVLGSVIEVLAVLLGPSASEFLGSSFSVAIGARLLAGIVGLIAGRFAGDGRSLMSIAAAIALASFLFDGHTVTKGNRAVTAVVDVLHVGSASVWVGGLACLLGVVASGRTEDFAAAATRFSRVALGAVAAVGLSGIALSLTVLDTFGDLWATTWGKLLLAKAALVAAAAVAGAINHFALVPRIASASHRVAARLRNSIVVELALLGVVALLTAALVAAAA